MGQILAVFIVLFARLQCHVPAAYGDKGRLFNPKNPAAWRHYVGVCEFILSAAEDVSARTPELWWTESVIVVAILAFCGEELWRAFRIWNTFRSFCNGTSGVLCTGSESLPVQTWLPLGTSRKTVLLSRFAQQLCV